MMHLFLVKSVLACEYLTLFDNDEEKKPHYHQCAEQSHDHNSPV